MSNLLSLISSTAVNKTGTFTSAEIEQQPKTWKTCWDKIRAEKEDILNFLNEPLALDDLTIVLTGAGSSAYIGDTASSVWLETFSKNAQAIPTTDLVTHFEQRISIQKPLLLISFARSGNSPESKATVDIANKRCSQVFHLIITCNPDGKLAQLSDEENTYVFWLPEAEDKSLAMTNSFTSMALAAILIPKLFSGDSNHLEEEVHKLAEYGHKIISENLELLFNVSQIDFSRIIFLGSGSLWGIAKESQLKVQELTNGEIIGKYDTYLGFRHGPKSIINDETLLVYLFSNNAEIQPYETDLMRQIAQHDIDLTTLAISETEFQIDGADHILTLNDSQELEEAFWSIVCTLPAQIIGFYKSLALNYNPDNPSPDGTISRVVEGVRIYKSDTENSN
jgi:tagatose-6-phosphate ketose/aldose isomerase